MNPATQYAIEAVELTRVVGNAERMACIRHLYDLARSGQLEQDLIERVRSVMGTIPDRDDNYPWRFDDLKADRIYRWFTYCHHVEGPLAGQPIELIPAHKFDMGCIFGWVHKDTGNRRFEKAYIQEARKNAKTTRLASVANYLMVGDSEEAPAVYPAAVDKKQARILYRASMAMARKSPDIRKRLKIRDYEMSHVTRGGQMTPLSKDTKNKDGLNPSGAIIDEYHAHPTSEIYDLLWSAWGQRAQALMTIITTAGMDVESPCYKEYTYCKQILAGDIANDRYFVMIRELEKNDDEHNPSNWIKSNPLRAITPAGLARLQEQHDEAFGSKDPAKIRTFRVKNLNIWIHGNEDTFMGEYMSKWDQLAVSREEFLMLTKDRLCLVGVDLSKKIDLTADGHVFALPDGRVAITATGFIPDAAITRHEKTDKIPYKDWIRDGWVIKTDGEVTDYHRLQTHLQDMEIERGWKIHEMCYDPYNATHFANEMQDLGYTTIEIAQWMKILSEPTKLFREMVAEGKIVHDGSPLLKWSVGNAMQIVDSKENIMISKKKAGDTRRIDPLAAVIDALVRLPVLREIEDFTKYVNSNDFGF
jgi:phage terminase large subunit-like protein